MIKINKKSAILVGVIIALAIIYFIYWSKMEDIKQIKMMNEYSDLIKKEGLTARESIKLHVGDFVVFKSENKMSALKLMDLKSAGPEYYEVHYDCYSRPVSTSKVFDKSSNHTQGKIFKRYHKINNKSYHEDDSIVDIERRIPCGNVLFDWSVSSLSSLSDEDNYAWLAIEKIQSGPSLIEYSFTNLKDISMIDLRSQSLKWQNLRN